MADTCSSSGGAESVVSAIAARMRALREERGLSLQEVASRAGIAKSHVWEIEQGRSRNPTIATTVGIARALGVSLDYLAGLTTARPDLHPEAMRIACEIDALLRTREADPAPAPTERSPAMADAETPT
jgi:transcriptional regulator with XRE-family HTH domain